MLSAAEMDMDCTCACVEVLTIDDSVISVKNLFVSCLFCIFTFSGQILYQRAFFNDD